MSLARGYRREIEGLPMRGGGIKDRIKNTALSVGGMLLNIGSNTLAKKRRVKRRRGGNLGNTGVKRRRKVTSLFINQ